MKIKNTWVEIKKGKGSAIGFLSSQDPIESVRTRAEAMAFVDGKGLIFNPSDIIRIVAVTTTTQRKRMDMLDLGRDPWMDEQSCSALISHDYSLNDIIKRSQKEQDDFISHYTLRPERTGNGIAGAVTTTTKIDWRI